MPAGRPVGRAGLRSLKPGAPHAEHRCWSIGWRVAASTGGTPGTPELPTQCWASPGDPLMNLLRGQNLGNEEFL